MESNKIENQESGSFRKILDDINEALLEIPTGATQEDLHEYTILISENISVLETLLYNDSYAAEALRNLSIITLAYPESEVRCTELEYQNGQRAKEIIFANKERTLEISLLEERNPRWSFLMYIKNIPGYEEEMGRYLQEQAAQSGLNLVELEKEWLKSGREDALDSHRIYNLFQLLKLESRAPGAPKALYENFGITTFARYPLGVLLKQFESLDEVDVPYGILLYPRSDWNGAFYNSVDMIEGLDDSLQDELILRIIECESGTEIARRLLLLQRKYEEGGQKIKFAVIGGHGNEHTIVFGEKGKGQEINIENLSGTGLQRTRNIFSDDVSFVISSCSTGTEGGVAQELSKVFDAEVIAPNGITNTKSIKYNKNNKGFDVEYRSAQTIKYKNGVIQ